MNVALFREHRATFGPYLRALRVGMDLSLRGAAGRLGITFAKLQKMETGGRFRIESDAMFDRLAEVYGRPFEEVLERAGVRFGMEPRAQAMPDPGMWAYTASTGWSRIVDILAEYDPMNKGDVDASMTAAGYGPRALEFGREYGLLVEVHPSTAGAKHAVYDYFVWVNVGERCEAVACRTLPDLLALLRELKPLVDPPYIGIAPGVGWRAGGKAVAAFGLRPDGSVLPLVPVRDPNDCGLEAEFGRLVFEG